MKGMTIRRTTLGIGLLVLLAAGLLAANSDKARWRLRLLAFKLQGKLAAVAWLDLPRYMVSTWTGQPPALPGLIRPGAHGDDPCPVNWETPLGSFWGRTTDADVLHLLVKEQLFASVYERGPVRIRSGDVVLDVGSHLGAFSRVALAKGARLVVAFEPDPVNIACFQRTFLQEISMGRLLLMRAAAWEAAGTLRFNPNSQNSGGGSVLPGTDRSQNFEVPATTIDETVKQLKLDRVDFIKMDIEGAERHALRGARQTLARFGPRLAICTYHRPDDRIVVPQLVLESRPSYRSFATKEQAYFH